MSEPLTPSVDLNPIADVRLSASSSRNPLLEPSPSAATAPVEAGAVEPTVPTVPTVPAEPADVLAEAVEDMLESLT